MKTVSIHDAKTNLSKYIAATKKGEKIFIGSHGKPEVELIIAKKPAKRIFGQLSGKVWVSSDFDDTPNEVVESMGQTLDEDISR